MSTFLSLWKDLAHLFYPDCCASCGSSSVQEKMPLCIRCLFRLRETGFAGAAGNAMEKTFTGRVHIEAAHAEYFFTQDSVVQHLIHALKYHHRQDAGHWLGKQLGNSIKSSGRFTDIDALIPMPMSQSKKRDRGYNQAEVIANTLADTLNKPVLADVLLKQKTSATQTRKNRYERWKNVEDIFIVAPNAEIQNMHLLLVDDVLTTGATLEAAARQLLHVKGIKISMATAAFSDK
jgi:ComF family protein